MKNLVLCVSVVVVALVGVVLARSGHYPRNGVFNFQMEDSDEMQLFNVLMTYNSKVHGSRLGTYSYKNCGDPTKEMLVLKTLTLGPDPLSFPGDLTVSFDGVIKSDIDAPLKAVVLIERKFGSTWIKIPCIGNIGSCNYPDLCELLAGATCPPPFVTHKIPCKCPFNMGSYTLPKTTIQVDAAVFPAGDYHASANLTLNGASVACVDLHATFV